VPLPSVSNDDAFDMVPGLLSASGTVTVADLPIAAYYDLSVARPAAAPAEALAGAVRRVAESGESLSGLSRRAAGVVGAGARAADEIRLLSRICG
jgi:hypothetical protein